jgi:YbbR domain-containing protein
MAVGFSERTRLSALRLTALALAILLWLFVTVERRGERPSEKVVEATVTYNAPPGMVILDPEEKVRVRLRGNERAIRRVNPYQIDVQAEVEEAREGLHEVRLRPENVMMPDGLEVVSVEPDVLRVRLDEEVQRLLPVEVPLVGEPAAGARLDGPARVSPERVLATGPSNLVRVLDALRTNPISLDGHAFSFQESTLVLSPDPLVQLQPQVVTVSVPMSQPRPVADGERNPRR